MRTAPSSGLLLTEGPWPDHQQGLGFTVAEAIRTRLAREIAAGTHRAGVRLPAERDLAQRLHVSRGTIRQALSMLRDDGLIASAPQAGWFVSDAGLLGEPPSALESFTEMAARRGATVETGILDRRIREPTYEEIGRLAVTVSTRVLQLARVRRIGGSPVCLDRSVIVLDRARGLEDVELVNASLYEELARLGARPVRADVVVEAGAVGAPECSHLAVPAGTPVLVTDEVAYSDAGTPLLLGRSVYRANAYRFRATLRRR